MNVREIAEKQGFDPDKFEKYALESKFKVKSAYGGARIDDSQADLLIEQYKNANPILSEEELEAIRIKEENEEIEAALRRMEYEKKMKEAAALKKETDKIILSSCSRLEGYKIVKYCGYISCDASTSVNRGHIGIFGDSFTNLEVELMSSLSHIRENALSKLRKKAYDMGCNAVIGIDLDYISLDPESANYNGGTTYLPYVFGVSANGTAVKLKKIEGFFEEEEEEEEKEEAPETDEDMEFFAEVFDDFIPDL